MAKAANTTKIANATKAANITKMANATKVAYATKTHQESTKDCHCVQREPITSERNRQRASVHGCFGGRGPCGGFFGSAYTMREGASFVCGAAREIPRGKRGAIFVFVMESRYLT